MKTVFSSSSCYSFMTMMTMSDRNPLRENTQRISNKIIILPHTVLHTCMLCIIHHVFLSCFPIQSAVNWNHSVSARALAAKELFHLQLIALNLDMICQKRVWHIYRYTHGILNGRRICSEEPSGNIIEINNLNLQLAFGFHSHQLKFYAHSQFSCYLFSIWLAHLMHIW